MRTHFYSVRERIERERGNPASGGRVCPPFLQREAAVIRNAFRLSKQSV